MIVHLDDFFLRRTKLAWTGEVSIDSIYKVAAILGEELFWDQSEQQEEIDRLLHILRDQHAVKI